MKKLLNFLIPLLFVSIPIWSQINYEQTPTKWMYGWTSFHPNLERYLNSEKTIPSIISADMTLSSDTVYMLSSNVYVTNDATLTIEPGTLIRCDHEHPASLVVTRGAKLIAEGNKNAPIIFTSSKAAKERSSGDWGGIVILGNGRINTASGVSAVEGNFIPKYSLYGGNNTTEESAILKYIRIEFPGHKINQSKELNGLTLCGIGSNTIIENVQISYSSDDSFEWFGGTGNFTNLISYKAKDDDFDIANGFIGSLTEIVSIRHPFISDTSGSYAIEIDGYNKEEGFSSEAALSTLRVKNAMIVNLADQESIHFIHPAISAKKLARLSMESSCISGFSNGIRLDNSFKKQSQVDRNIRFSNNVFNISEDGLKTKYPEAISNSKMFKKNKFTKYFKDAKDMYTNPTDEDQPSFALKKHQYKIVL